MKKKIIFIVAILFIALNTKAYQITINNNTYDSNSSFSDQGYYYSPDKKILVLNNYRGKEIISDGELTIRLEGLNLIESDTFGINSSNLLIYGEGRLSLDTKKGLKADYINLKNTNISFLTKNELLFESNTIYILSSNIKSENNAVFANNIDTLEIDSSNIEIFNSLGILKSNNIIIRHSKAFINISGTFVHDNNLFQIVNSDIEIISNDIIFKKNNTFLADKLYLVVNNGEAIYMGDYLNTIYFVINPGFTSHNVNISTDDINNNQEIKTRSIETYDTGNETNYDSESGNQINEIKENIEEQIEEKNNEEQIEKIISEEINSEEINNEEIIENEIIQTQKILNNPDTLDDIPKYIILIIVVIFTIIISSMVLIGIKNWTN